MKDDWPYKCNAIAALTWAVISNVKVSISPKLGKVHIKKKRFDTHWSNFRQGVSINKFPPLLQILNKRRNPLVLFNFTLDCRAPFPNWDSAARHISVWCIEVNAGVSENKLHPDCPDCPYCWEEERGSWWCNASNSLVSQRSNWIFCKLSHHSGKPYTHAPMFW